MMYVIKLLKGIIYIIVLYLFMFYLVFKKSNNFNVVVENV